jgi:hypothetical protein
MLWSIGIKDTLVFRRAPPIPMTVGRRILEKIWPSSSMNSFGDMLCNDFSFSGKVGDISLR